MAFTLKVFSPGDWGLRHPPLEVNRGLTGPEAVEAAMKIIEGTARSMGIEVEG